ncbi:MAG TPA: type II CAAX endopeptidase family protein [Chitinophagaceae bacterium]|nr:type II CAAX endopeptidase family protein [Chitinophagaceae bacterium]
MPNRTLTLIKAILFCLVCAITFAAFSGLTKNSGTAWKDHLSLAIAIIITYGLVILFAKWQKLNLINVGIIPGKAFFKKITAGFCIGLLMTALQPALVFIMGHYSIAVTPGTSYNVIFFYLTLYILVALREELAFRSYPLFSLHYRFRLWPAQLIILVIFSAEHIAGGMTPLQAFLGAGTGALLFGLAAIKTKGIALPVALHTAWNFGQWCFGFKKETGLLHGITEKGFEDAVERNAWISYLIIMAIVIVVFYFYKPYKSNSVQN